MKLATIKDGSTYTSKAEIAIRDPARALPTVSRDYPYAYGQTYGINNSALEMCQCAVATHEVVFSEPGAYRLEFSTRSRVWIYPTPSMND